MRMRKEDSEPRESRLQQNNKTPLPCMCVVSSLVKASKVLSNSELKDAVRLAHAYQTASSTNSKRSPRSP